MAAIVGLTTEKASQLLKQFGHNEIAAKAAANAAFVGPAISSATLAFLQTIQKRNTVIKSSVATVVHAAPM